MTDFRDLLRPEGVLARLAAPNKKLLFQAVAQVAATVHDLDPQSVVDALQARERLGSTGFGGGIAIPHGRVCGIGGIVGVFARLAQPIDFQAVDDLPVDLVFALLSPPDAGADHLKALARVSRALRDRALLAKLRGAVSPDALFALLTGAETRDAA